jgi:hypothetical protein
MLSVPQITGVGELLCPVIETASANEIKAFLEHQFAGQRAVVRLDHWIGTGNIMIDVERDTLPPFDTTGAYNSMYFYGRMFAPPPEIAILLSDVEFRAPNRLLEFNRILKAFMGLTSIQIASAAGGEPLLALMATSIQHPTFNGEPT